MRKKLAVLAIACSVGMGGTGIIAAPHAAAASEHAGQAHVAYCVYGRIGGKRKCLRAGEYCARRYQRQYVRYGFSCSKRDYLGDWHLVRI